MSDTPNTISEKEFLDQIALVAAGNWSAIATFHNEAANVAAYYARVAECGLQAFITGYETAVALTPASPQLVEFFRGLLSQRFYRDIDNKDTEPYRHMCRILGVTELTFTPEQFEADITAFSQGRRDALNAYAGTNFIAIRKALQQLPLELLQQALSIVAEKPNTPDNHLRNVHLNIARAIAALQRRHGIQSAGSTNPELTDETLNKAVADYRSGDPDAFNIFINAGDTIVSVLPYFATETLYEALHTLEHDSSTKHSYLRKFLADALRGKLSKNDYTALEAHPKVDDFWLAVVNATTLRSLHMLLLDAYIKTRPAGRHAADFAAKLALLRGSNQPSNPSATIRNIEDVIKPLLSNAEDGDAAALEELDTKLFESADSLRYLSLDVLLRCISLIRKNDSAKSGAILRKLRGALRAKLVSVKTAATAVADPLFDEAWHVLVEMFALMPDLVDLVNIYTERFPSGKYAGEFRHILQEHLKHVSRINIATFTTEEEFLSLFQFKKLRNPDDASRLADADTAREVWARISRLGSIEAMKRVCGMFMSAPDNQPPTAPYFIAETARYLMAHHDALLEAPTLAFNLSCTINAAPDGTYDPDVRLLPFYHAINFPASQFTAKKRTFDSAKAASVRMLTSSGYDASILSLLNKVMTDNSPTCVEESGFSYYFAFLLHLHNQYDNAEKAGVLHREPLLEYCRYVTARYTPDMLKAIVSIMRLGFKACSTCDEVDELLGLLPQGGDFVLNEPCINSIQKLRFLRLFELTDDYEAVWQLMSPQPPAFMFSVLYALIPIRGIDRRYDTSIGCFFASKLARHILNTTDRMHTNHNGTRQVAFALRRFAKPYPADLLGFQIRVLLACSLGTNLVKETGDVIHLLYDTVRSEDMCRQFIAELDYLLFDYADSLKRNDIADARAEIAASALALMRRNILPLRNIKEQPLRGYGRRLVTLLMDFCRAGSFWNREWVEPTVSVAALVCDSAEEFTALLDPLQQLPDYQTVQAARTVIGKMLMSGFHPVSDILRKLEQGRADRPALGSLVAVLSNSRLATDSEEEAERLFRTALHYLGNRKINSFFRQPSPDGTPARTDIPRLLAFIANMRKLALTSADKTGFLAAADEWTRSIRIPTCLTELALSAAEVALSADDPDSARLWIGRAGNTGSATQQRTADWKADLTARADEAIRQRSRTNDYLTSIDMVRTALAAFEVLEAKLFDPYQQRKPAVFEAYDHLLTKAAEAVAFNPLNTATVRSDIAQALAHNVGVRRFMCWYFQPGDQFGAIDRLYGARHLLGHDTVGAILTALIDECGVSATRNPLFKPGKLPRFAMRLAYAAVRAARLTPDLAKLSHLLESARALTAMARTNQKDDEACNAALDGIERELGEIRRASFSFDLPEGVDLPTMRERHDPMATALFLKGFQKPSALKYLTHGFDADKPLNFGEVLTAMRAFLAEQRATAASQIPSKVIEGIDVMLNGHSDISGTDTSVWTDASGLTHPESFASQEWARWIEGNPMLHPRASAEMEPLIDLFRLSLRTDNRFGDILFESLAKAASQKGVEFDTEPLKRRCRNLRNADFYTYVYDVRRILEAIFNDIFQRDAHARLTVGMTVTSDTTSIPNVLIQRFTIRISHLASPASDINAFARRISSGAGAMAAIANRCRGLCDYSVEALWTDDAEGSQHRRRFNILRTGAPEIEELDGDADDFTHLLTFIKIN